MAIEQNILLTADVLIFGKGKEQQLFLLLIQRKNEPFKGQWAFPGGFIEDNEDLNTAAARELEEETGLHMDPQNLRQLGAWGTPGRDPRGRTVTVVFIGEANIDESEIKAADDAEEVQWWPLDELPDLAFDHADILRAALERGGLKS